MRPEAGTRVAGRGDQLLRLTNICVSTADYTAYGERTFKVEKATTERLGLAKKS